MERGGDGVLGREWLSLEHVLERALRDEPQVRPGERCSWTTATFSCGGSSSLGISVSARPLLGPAHAGKSRAVSVGPLGQDHGPGCGRAVAAAQAGALVGSERPIPRHGRGGRTATSTDGPGEASAQSK